MNKQKFIELVENPNLVSGKDIGILTELAANYPYSSLVHTLLAKAKQHQSDARDALATAAVYISDRSILKEVMEGGPFYSSGNTAGASSSLAGGVVAEDPPVVERTPNLEPELLERTDSDEEIENRKNVFNELEENLRLLREQKDRFDNHPENTGSDPADEPRLYERHEASGENTPPVSRLGTLPEAVQDLISNKEEQEINDPKRMEQNNLIDNFIKISSSINRKYRSADGTEGDQNDLTSSYTLTPPDLATENLALIMIRQGKTEKAIDIYEKLILKYPQKRAYFASCIEKLKTD